MFKKILFLAISLLLVLVALGGCSSSTNGSYAGILVVNEKKYIWQGEIKDNEFTLGKKIGEVQRKVKPEVNPKGNLSSNFLEVGEEIYSSNEDSRVLIVKRESGSLEKMTEEGYYKSE
ncbi:hypothetical protein V7138_01645 [Bacillus sp. JJ1533]|uniref:hypothetical protein n=1 Tax=Bacillus sp. JJ1533 TaxID=3122959 RepID=UPI002FFEDC1C